MRRIGHAAREDLGVGVDEIELVVAAGRAGLVVRHVIIFGYGHGLQRAIIDESQHRTPRTFNHGAALEAFGRPFEQVDQMNGHLICEWCRRVREDETIICLGDVADREAWRDRRLRVHVRGCPGRKILVLGNHDAELESETLREVGFELCQLALCATDPPLALSHVPLRRPPIGTVNLHGTRCHRRTTDRERPNPTRDDPAQTRTTGTPAETNTDQRPQAAERPRDATELEETDLIRKPRKLNRSATDRLIALVESEMKKQGVNGQEVAREARLPADVFRALQRGHSGRPSTAPRRCSRPSEPR